MRDENRPRTLNRVEGKRKNAVRVLEEDCAGCANLSDNLIMISLYTDVKVETLTVIDVKIHFREALILWKVR
jgi:hypothetical protein